MQICELAVIACLSLLANVALESSGFNPTSKPSASDRVQFVQLPNQSKQNEQRASAPVLNRSTGQIEKRRGEYVSDAEGRKLWFHPPIYDGVAYVHLANTGWIQMDVRYETFIYPLLTSGDPIKISQAINLIVGNAMMQGMKPWN